MDAFFLRLLHMSITAGWLILAVILLRPFLRLAPKWLSCILWAMVAVRLLCPVALKSPLSLIPGEEMGSVSPLHFEMFPAGMIWAAGLMAMLLYVLAGFFRIRRKVQEAVPLRDNVLLCDAVETPFILGVFRPRIYLPSGIDAKQMTSVIAHEETHLKRGDHWWKPLGFGLLAIYWFHPLVWAAYILFCRDIELACDEKVIKNMDLDEKKEYSRALVESSVHRRMIMVCPLAFGGAGVRERVKNVLNYRKPALWMIGTAVMVCAAVAVCFLTNPNENASDTGAVIFAGDGNKKYIAVPVNYENGIYYFVPDGESTNSIGN